jgi:hypothetical protein
MKIISFAAMLTKSLCSTVFHAAGNNALILKQGDALFFDISGLQPESQKRQEICSNISCAA